jgi:hypothetical protein
LAESKATRRSGEVVQHLAQAVSHSDRDFNRCPPARALGLEIEISVLTPEREVADVAEIEVGATA